MARLAAAVLSVVYCVLAARIVFFISSCILSSTGAKSLTSSLRSLKDNVSGAVGVGALGGWGAELRSSSGVYPHPLVATVTLAVTNEAQLMSVVNNNLLVFMGLIDGYGGNIYHLLRESKVGGFL